jgi:hypothetical protein
MTFQAISLLMSDPSSVLSDTCCCHLLFRQSQSGPMEPQWRDYDEIRKRQAREIGEPAPVGLAEPGKADFGPELGPGERGPG